MGNLWQAARRSERCDECLNVNLFFSLEDVREKLESWRQDYNTLRPQGSLDVFCRRQMAQRALRPEPTITPTSEKLTLHLAREA
jgi:transposase InsO family protein